VHLLGPLLPYPIVTDRRSTQTTADSSVIVASSIGITVQWNCRRRRSLRSAQSSLAADGADSTYTRGCLRLGGHSDDDSRVDRSPAPATLRSVHRFHSALLQPWAVHMCVGTSAKRCAAAIHPHQG